jgi:hypothetical protein
MQTPDYPLTLGRAARFRLSTRGRSTEAAYRSQVDVTRGPARRTAFERARSDWAHSHGLEPDDGVYLAELRGGSLTLTQLGEELAVCGQKRDMISAALLRLVSRGLVERVTGKE